MVTTHINGFQNLIITMTSSSTPLLAAALIVHINNDANATTVAGLRGRMTATNAFASREWSTMISPGKTSSLFAYSNSR